MKELRKFQGGLSEGVFLSHEFQRYVSQAGGKFVAGYLGDSTRSAARDRFVELALRRTGLGDNGVACWLTSTAGRHMMDDVPRGAGSLFKAHVLKWTKNAFREVTIWSHPDHRGSAADSARLAEKIFGDGGVA